jgi:hypothetical protein
LLLGGLHTISIIYRSLLKRVVSKKLIELIKEYIYIYTHIDIYIHISSRGLYRVQGQKGFLKLTAISRACPTVKLGSSTNSNGPDFRERKSNRVHLCGSPRKATTCNPCLSGFQKSIQHIKVE